jgi:methionyl-tRNA formyltransferase
LEAGDNPVGVTVLFTVSKMDAGPIVSQKEEIIDENDTATNVLPHLFEIGTELLVDAMPDLLLGKMTMETAADQDESLIVQAAMIDSSEAEFKPWEESAATLHNRLRGFSMWPGGFLYLEVGEGTEPTKFKILETRVLKDTAAPTDAVEAGPSRKDGLRLVCFDGSILEINRLQPATRKPMDALSFINGLQGKTVRWVKSPEAVTA